MVAISVKPFALSNSTLKVDADNHESAVSQVEFQPQGGIVTWKGLTPASSFSAPQNVTWQVVIAYAQDWATTGSLSNYLMNNPGKTVIMAFAPVAGGPTWYARVIIQPGAIGGTVDSVGTGTVTLGVVGTPSTTAITTV
jgi:hypothetical protein